MTVSHKNVLLAYTLDILVFLFEILNTPKTTCIIYWPWRQNHSMFSIWARSFIWCCYCPSPQQPLGYDQDDKWIAHPGETRSGSLLEATLSSAWLSFQFSTGCLKISHKVNSHKVRHETNRKKGVAGHDVHFCNPNTLICAHTFFRASKLSKHVFFLVSYSMYSEDWISNVGDYHSTGLWALLAFYILFHTVDSSRLKAPLEPEDSSPAMAWHSKSNF